LFPSANPPIEVPKVGSLVTENLQPEVMAALESKGYRFTDLMAKARWGKFPAQPYAGLGELIQKNDWYVSMVSTLESEIDAHAKTDNFNIRADDGRNRLFDKRWLRSADANFELVAVVNRIDRRRFADNCGEVRFIYRLAYDKNNRGAGFSRLPMTLNWVFEVPKSLNSAGKACVDDAHAWKVPVGVDDGEKFVDWMAKTPLRAGTLRFQQLEVNLQVSRIVASNKPDLGGSATYFLMIFAPGSANGFMPIKLRNTIDAGRVGADAALRSELVTFIKQNAKTIDDGGHVIPEKFLATKSVSRTTHGLNRLANMPFGSLLGASEFKDVDFTGFKLLNSPQSLLRRLDDGTCAGCHQGDSVAGFHVLGFESGDKVHPLNSVRVGYSPHFHSERIRRKKDIDKLASGLLDVPRLPLSFEADGALTPKAGSRCITSANERHFQPGVAFGCGQGTGLRCEILEDNDQLSLEVGTCVRDVPTAGDPCVKGKLTNDYANPNNDSIDNTTFACGGKDSNSGYVCLQPVQGVPGGLCYRKCAPGLKAFSPGTELCAYNGGSAFDSCAASGDFSKCLLGGTSRGLRQACDENTACREDYICQAFYDIDTTAKKVTAGKDSRGYCVPTYFIFQLRLDGHPVP
jgi:hypothetical protein